MTCVLVTQALRKIIVVWGNTTSLNARTSCVSRTTGARTHENIVPQKEEKQNKTKKRLMNESVNWPSYIRVLSSCGLHLKRSVTVIACRCSSLLSSSCLIGARTNERVTRKQAGSRWLCFKLVRRLFCYCCDTKFYLIIYFFWYVSLFLLFSVSSCYYCHYTSSLTWTYRKETPSLAHQLQSK